MRCLWLQLFPRFNKPRSRVEIKKQTPLQEIEAKNNKNIYQFDILRPRANNLKNFRP